MTITRLPEYWDHVYSQPIGWQPVTEEEVFRFQDRTGAAPGQVAMDIGTGRGDFACRLSRLGLLTTGYDHSQVAIDYARKVHGQHGGTLAFRRHDFDVDPIPRHLAPDSIDIVTCRLTLPYLDRERFIADVRRWLRRDGVLHMTTDVIEKQPDGARRGLSEDVIKGLAHGWASYERYDLDPDGVITAVALRGPYG
ncbi:class I SAM-dependent methyltransferase [Streptomyces sp. NPDC055103]